MDKYEYNLKLEEINKLVEHGNYEDAAAIADTIDWRRVRNARTLCMVSEIYEANDRMEDSKAVLMRAYRRSQMGRRILYRLTEVAVKMGEFDEAIEYYSEFVDNAPNDNSRYVLKYEIYKGRGSSLQDQISILEEYKEREYTERWAYELAELYYKAGEDQKCVEECDDLVLWFHQGDYVIKALELKSRLETLSPEQQSIYDHRNEYVPNKAELVEAAMPTLEKVITENMPTSEEEAITDSIITATQRELAQAVSQHAAEAQKDVQQDESWRYHTGPQSSGVPAGEEQTEPELPQEPEAQPEAPGLRMEDLQRELANSMREIVAGITKKESDEGIIEPMNDKPFHEEAIKEEPLDTGKQEEPRVNIDDVLTAMAAAGTKEEAIRQAAAALEKLRGVQDGQPEEETVRRADTAASAEEVSGTREVPEPEEISEPEEVSGEEEIPEPEEISEPEVISGEDEPAPEAEDVTEPEEAAEAAAVSGDEAAMPKKPMEEEKEEPGELDLAAALERAAGVENMRPRQEEARPEAETPRKKEASGEVFALTPDEQYIFSYFSSVQGLREQIAAALHDAKKKVKLDRTSRSGNIVITGLPGSGRTTLAIRIAKTLSRFKGEESARIAKIYAEDFNKKDIPSTIAKIAGGTLIIEEAGDLAEGVVQQLSKAMEFRTDGLIIILEDEKHLLKALFDKYPDLAEKFTSEVTVPIFTNDELVAFGKTYAYDEDYKIEETATMALYNRIGELQTPERPVTVLDVKEIVDGAIKRSERFGIRKLGMILSKKRYDEDDRVILYEKDFK